MANKDKYRRAEKEAGNKDNFECLNANFLAGEDVGVNKASYIFEDNQTSLSANLGIDNNILASDYANAFECQDAAFIADENSASFLETSEATIHANLDANNKIIAGDYTNGFECRGTVPLAGEGATVKKATSILGTKDTSPHANLGINNILASDYTNAFECRHTASLAVGSTVNDISRELIQTDSWSDFRNDLFDFENTIQHYFNDLTSSSWFDDRSYDTRIRLNRVLDSKSRLNERWDKLQILYESVRHHYHNLLSDHYEDALLKIFNFEQLIDPFQNYLTKVKERFSQLVEYTNKLSKLLFESVELEDQRFEFRKIYGFLFKNLDDESASDRQKEGVRKQPKIAFINYSSNFKPIGGHYAVRQRINSSFKKEDLRK